MAKPCIKQEISIGPRQNKFQDKFSLWRVENLSYLRKTAAEKDLRDLGINVGLRKRCQGSGSIKFYFSANQKIFCKITSALSYDKWTNISTLKKKKVVVENSILSKLVLSGLIEQNPQNKNQFRLSKENKQELEYLRDLYDPTRNVRRRY